MTTNLAAQTNEECWHKFSDGSKVYDFVEEGDFIWVCHADGILKIDKSTNEILKVINEKTSGMRGFIAHTITIDVEGYKWIGLPNFVIGRFKDDDWKFYDHTNTILPEDHPSNYTFNDIVAASDGRVWLTGWHGVYEIIGDSLAFHEKGTSIVPDYPSQCVFEDKQGNIWLGFGNNYRNGTMVKIDTLGQWIDISENSSYYFPTEHSINDIYVDENEVVWMATSGGLGKYVENSDVDLWYDKYTFSIVPHSSGILYTGAAGGIVIFDPSTTDFNFFEIPKAVYLSSISRLLMDTENVLWLISSGFNGLYKSQNGSLEEVTPLISGLETAPVKTVFKRSSGELVISTSWGGIYYFDGVSNWDFKEELLIGLPDAWVLDMVELGETLYGIRKVAGHMNLITLEDNVETEIFYEGESNLTYALDVYGDSLVVGAQSGLFLFHDDVWTKLSTTTIRDLKIDSFGNIWMLTDVGVSYFDGNQLSHWDSTNSIVLFNFSINNLHIDAANNPWFIMDYSKLVKFDGSDFIEFGDAQTLANDNFLWILHVDDENDFWVSSREGVFHYENEVITHSKNIGLSSTCTVDGDKLWLGTSDALWLYDPLCEFTNVSDVSYNNPHQSNVIAYPNPSNGNVFFQLPENYSKGNVLIFDSTGKMIDNVIVNQSEREWHAHYFPDGIYFYKFMIDNKFIGAGKLILQH